MKTLSDTMLAYVLEKYPNDPYAKFINTPISLGQFIPTDEEGNILEEVEIQGETFVKRSGKNATLIKWRKYQQACERVLFEGWKLENKSSFTMWIENEDNTIVFTDRGKINFNGINIKTIEDLIKYNLPLTDNALKIIQNN